MEETAKGGPGPPWAVAPLERERDNFATTKVIATRNRISNKIKFIYIKNKSE